MNTNLVTYYKERAAEYENIYYKPERQQDLAAAAIALQHIFLNKEVLEIACGTGFWTEKIAAVANTVVATDINQSVLDIARQKNYPKSNVTFQVADLMHYTPDKKFESVFGGFIWSHILMQDLDNFLTAVNSYVIKGGIVVFMDNNYVEKSNLPVTYTDEQGNTFQKRMLADNTSHLVLKNFPTETYLRDKLAKAAFRIRFIQFTYYWLLIYKKS